MSRSLRKPYFLWCGSGSRHRDKKRAARAFRRAFDQWARGSVLDEESLSPVIRECGHNNNVSWSSDGGAVFYRAPLEGDNFHVHMYERLKRK